MGLDLRLDAKMTQSLVMSPRMQQAIKILQLNHLEMVNAIQEAVLENPTLEAQEAPDGPSDTEVAMRESADRAQAEHNEQSNGSDDSNIDWEKVLESMSERKGSSSLGGTIHDELPPIEANLTYGTSLADHLLFQLQMVRMNEDERKAAETIIHNLDERGYLIMTLEEVATAAEVTAEDAESGLEIVQALDPIGCGARDLTECLVLQARLHFPEDPTFERILKSHLGNLERRNYGAIAKDLGLDVEDVQEYHKMIKELEPHPGRGYSTDEPRYISPDVFVDKHGDEWVILLNEDGVPDLKIAPYYLKILRGASKTDKAYLTDKLRGAQFLIKSINKRRKTIRRVMESILKFQRDFFDYGPGHLRPLVLQDVASDIGVHMSTVSRVTTNKYVHTPHGIFELKYFFSAGVRQSSGEDVAAEAVKSRIKALVKGEDARKPLSDQQLADLLKKEGVRVARRTVAKYREALGILPSSQRKSSF
jgi:RNA polymerase sigma-54 factor